MKSSMKGWRSDGRYPDTNRAPQLVVEFVRRKLTTQGDRFFLDGQPFKMWGIRTASATKDDELTEHLIAQLGQYPAHGVNAVTVFYTGSSGGNHDPFSPDGLSVFFHHSPWCQGASAMRYDLAGDGTEQTPGIRWYFEYVGRHAKTR